jgi:hypothetical protein
VRGLVAKTPGCRRTASGIVTGSLRAVPLEAVEQGGEMVVGGKRAPEQDVPVVAGDGRLRARLSAPCFGVTVVVEVHGRSSSR